MPSKSRGQHLAASGAERLGSHPKAQLDEGRRQVGVAFSMVPFLGIVLKGKQMEHQHIGQGGGREVP